MKIGNVIKSISNKKKILLVLSALILCISFSPFLGKYYRYKTLSNPFLIEALYSTIPNGASEQIDITDLFYKTNGERFSIEFNILLKRTDFIELNATPFKKIYSYKRPLLIPVCKENIYLTFYFDKDDKVIKVSKSTYSACI